MGFVTSHCAALDVQFDRGVGWAIAAGLTCSDLRRKVRASQDAVVGNTHRSQEPGQCHRKQTADRRRCPAREGDDEVRVKRCGKSAPADRVTGSARQTPPEARPSRAKFASLETESRREAVRLVTRPGRLLEPTSNRRPREMVAHDRTRLTGPLRFLVHP